MRSTIAVACVPVALALVTFFASTRRLPPSGDEPHYLIMADSIASDFDLDLHNNYLNDFNTHRIIGLTIPHVYNVERGWMPGHEPGLSILIALPFKIGGISGARLGLCLFAGLLPWSLFVWFHSRLRNSAVDDRAAVSTAAWLTLGLTISVPICFGAEEIYGDLVAGAIATSLLLHVLRALDENRPTWAWALFWLTAGLFPWLHAKFALTTVILACAGAGALWRRRLVAPPGSTVRAMVAAPLVVLGPALLVSFNTWASGSPLGFRHANELTTSFARGAEIFLGLHFDQSQGMFVQQPLLLAGVLALPMFARRHRGLALLWGLVYLSLILPNALELTRYGGDGPDGRFSWSAAWLWAVPIGFVVAEHHDRLARWVGPAAIAGWIYQAALAARWLRAPDLLFPTIDEGLQARDSLFPVAWHARLPSYYFWDFSSYWTYRPNVLAMVLVAALLVIGVRAARNPLLLQSPSPLVPQAPSPPAP